MRDGVPDRRRAERGQQSTEFLQRADGSKRTVVITSAGPVDGLQVQVMRDETDLEAVRRARDSILANISHEFRTPLAAQLASIEPCRKTCRRCHASRSRSSSPRCVAGRCA